MIDWEEPHELCRRDRLGHNLHLVLGLGYVLDYDAMHGERMYRREGEKRTKDTDSNR